jgi:hypothetical protein
MPGKVTEKIYLPNIEKDISALMRMKIVVGPAGEDNSTLAAYAAANEFGAEITPKSTTYLAVPAHPEAKERSPRELELVPIFPKDGTPMLAKVQGKKIIPYYILKKKVVIPERSYLRSAFDKKETQESTMRIFREALHRLISGAMSARNVADVVGSHFASCVKKQISSNIGPENAPITLALKRAKSTTLVDEGHLLKSISWEIKSA